MPRAPRHFSPPTTRSVFLLLHHPTFRHRSGLVHDMASRCKSMPLIILMLHRESEFSMSPEYLSYAVQPSAWPHPSSWCQCRSRCRRRRRHHHHYQPIWLPPFFGRRSLAFAALRRQKIINHSPRASAAAAIASDWRRVENGMAGPTSQYSLISALVFSAGSLRNDG